MNEELFKKLHDKHAPYWAITFIVLIGVGLSTIWIDLGAFWKGYVLDMVAPGWNYILFRGLFTARANNRWTRFFTPTRTFIIFLIVLFGIETLQFYNIYDATFDPWDFLAYCSVLIPLYILDLRLFRKA